MKKIIFLTLLLAVACLLPTTAQVRTQAQIQKLAQEHFTNRPSSRVGLSSYNFQTIPASAALKTKVRSVATNTAAEAFYVATANGGFVIISGDERMRSVLGYSDNDEFDVNKIPTDLYWLLSGYVSEFEYLQSANPKAVTTRTTASSPYPEAVSSLMSPKGINYSQEAPFNGQTPLFDGKRAVTGCVPTAMAMVMRYHEYPARAIREEPKSDIDITSKPIEWEKIKQLNTAGGHDAVSWLMLICGKSVGATYTVNETTAPDSEVSRSLRDNFGYDAGMQFHRRDVYSTADWENLLKKEVSEGRPVVYGGQSAKTAGHCFVMDGYDANNLFHMNWGWGGSMNGHYSLTSLNPGFSGPGSSVGGFNVSQTATVGIQKPTGSNSSIVSNFIILTEGFTLNTTSIARNGAFSVNKANYMNQGDLFTGSIQAALYKGGKLVTLLGSPLWFSNIVYKYDMDAAFDNLTIPSAINDGEYQLYIVTKDQRESQWQIVRMAQTKPYSYNVTVSGSGVVFKNPVNLTGLAQASFTQEDNLYVQYGAKFKMVINNSGSEWTGRIGVQMQMVNDPKTTRVIAQDRVVFKVGKNEINLYDEALPLSAGEYTMQSVYSTSGSTWLPVPGSAAERVMVEIPDYTAFVLEVKSGTPVRKGLTEKDKVQIVLDIENTGKGPFSSRFRFEIFDIKTQGQVARSDAHDIYIDKGKRQSVVLTYGNKLSDGDYCVDVYYVHNSLGTQFLIKKGVNFTVRSLTGFKK